MKSTTRNLVLVAAGIVVLGGVIATLTLTGGNTPTASSSETSTPTIDLVSKKATDIASMQVTNKKGSYTIVPQENAQLSTSSAASSSSDVTYTIQELNGAPVDTSSTENVVKFAYSLVASKNLGEVSDMSPYGLNDPQATVKIRFKDNTSYNYKIGKVTPSDASSYYMCADNSKTVYIVSLDSALLQDKMDFVQKSILAITPATSTSSGTTQQANDFTKVALSGTNFPKEISIEASKNGFDIKTPVSTSADADKISALTKQLETLSATSAAAIKPDAATLKKYGFDKPSAVVTFTVNKKSYKLIAGAKDGSNRYVMLDGVNVIYTTTDASVNAWAETSFFTLRSKFVFLPLLTDVSNMTVTAGSEVNTFAITKTKDEKKSTQDTPAYNYTVTGNNGKALTYEKNFKNYYQTVIAVSLLEDYNKKPSGTPAVTITYKYYNGSSHTVQFYNVADRRYAAVVDGVVCGAVISTDVDTILSNTKQMENNALISVS